MSEAMRAMKVAMVEPSGRGGLCHHSYNLCRALAERGCDVHLVTADPYELSDLPHNFAVSKFRMRTVGGLAAAIRSIMSFRPDVIHHQATNLHPFFEWCLMRVARTFGRAPYVVAAHEVIPHIPPGWQRPFIGLKLRSADAVIVHSENTRKEALDVFATPARKVHVIPVGDYRFLRDLAPLGKPAPWTREPGVKYVLFFGGIMKYKGLMCLIEAVARLRTAGRPVNLVVVGRPVDPWDEYESAMRRLNVYESALLSLSYIDTADIPGYFDFADALCVPYLFCSESGVLLAADALDKPVVATSVGGNVAAHADGLVQELVPPGDVDALAAALDRTLFRFDRDEYLAKKAARDPSIRSWREIAGRTIELYQSALCSKDREPACSDALTGSTE